MLSDLLLDLPRVELFLAQHEVQNLQEQIPSCLHGKINFIVIFLYVTNDFISHPVQMVQHFAQE